MSRESKRQTERLQIETRKIQPEPFVKLLIRNPDPEAVQNTSERNFEAISAVPLHPTRRPKKRKVRPRGAAARPPATPSRYQ